MKTKHTPEPWAAIAVHDCILIRSEKSHTTVAEAKSLKDIPLITSSPKMLSFLIKLEKAIRTEPFDDDLYKELTELIKSATE